MNATTALTRFDDLQLSTLRIGQPQSSGALSVLPLFGHDHEGYAPPMTGLKISKVEGYGNLELKNDGGGLAIVPLHIGYIQSGAQNHAMCRAALLGEGQQTMFNDACCVQAAEGGYLEGREQWFFVLPVELREKALKLRGVEGFSKLWDDISDLNARYEVRNRGHLDEIIVEKRPYLTQLQSRFEVLDGQTGALFFADETLVGLEVAPNAAYYAELHPALVCFAYGALAMHRERDVFGDGDGESQSEAGSPLAGETLEQIEQSLRGERQARSQRLLSAIEAVGPQEFSLQQEESYLDHTLSTAEGKDFTGQIVKRADSLVYASVFARAASL
jgi:hypothetical protein